MFGIKLIFYWPIIYIYIYMGTFIFLWVCLFYFCVKKFFLRVFHHFFDGKCHEKKIEGYFDPKFWRKYPSKKIFFEGYLDLKFWRKYPSKKIWRIFWPKILAKIPFKKIFFWRVLSSIFWTKMPFKKFFLKVLPKPFIFLWVWANPQKNEGYFSKFSLRI